MLKCLPYGGCHGGPILEVRKRLIEQLSARSRVTSYRRIADIDEREAHLKLGE
ncbi:tetratricopeptide repeat protein [Sesbania bispinosa]|nr:tetratricopeptide repeat protein [Sesbania bispinosa]